MCLASCCRLSWVNQTDPLHQGEEVLQRAMHAGLLMLAAQDLALLADFAAHL